MKTKVSPRHCPKAPALGFSQAGVRLKAGLRGSRQPPATHWSAFKRAAELGAQQVCLADTSVCRRECAGPLTSFSSWDNQSFVFPLSTLFLRGTGKALKQRRPKTIIGHLQASGFWEAGDEWTILLSPTA